MGNGTFRTGVFARDGRRAALCCSCVLLCGLSWGACSDHYERIKARPEAALDLPALPFVGELLAFDASRSRDPLGRSLRYRWRFGDGTAQIEGASPSTRYVYQRPGDFRVCVDVIEPGGLGSTACEILLVRRRGDAGVKDGPYDVLAPDVRDFGVDGADHGADAGDLGVDAGDLGVDTGDLGPDVGDLGVDAGDQGLDAGDMDVDTSDQGADAADQGADASDLGVDADAVDQGADLADVGVDQGADVGVDQGADVGVDQGADVGVDQGADQAVDTLLSDGAAVACLASASGGSGAAGYDVLTPSQPCVIDISAMGTKLGIKTDDQGLLTLLPFVFRYFGVAQSAVGVSSNGYLQFPGGTLALTESTPASIPTVGDPNNLIAAFWDNLAPRDSSSAVYVATLRQAPKRVFVVQWDGWSFSGNPTGARLVFSVRLYEQSNVIDLVYHVLDGGSRAKGTMASVGIEDSTGVTGVPFSFQSASLTAPSALRYVPRP